MIETICQLHSRIRQNPELHLGRRDITRLAAYELGYELAIGRWQRPALQEQIAFRTFQDWAEHKFNWTGEMGCRQNTVSFALLFADDDPSAFDLFFELRDSAIKEVGHAAQPPENPWVNSASLVEFILDEKFKSRPAMYFGEASVDGLWAMCSGYFWCERDIGVMDSPDQLAMRQFQQWVADRYPFSANRSWNRTLKFLSLGYSRQAWESFYDLFEMFRDDASPDAMSKTGERMLANITKAILAGDPSASPESIAATLTSAVKGICPT